MIKNPLLGYDAITDLVTTAYLSLQKINPNHSLLKYLINVSQNKLEINRAPEIAEEFFSRFKPSHLESAEITNNFFTRYYLAIREELDRGKNSQNDNVKNQD